MTTVDVAAPSISDHCTDFTITLDRAKSAVVVTLLGTRIFPNPSVYDVVMDLRAETQPFLGGVAHAGMVIGTRNLMRRSFSVLVDTVAAHPGYSVLVVGYSLGAGLAQLYTAQLLSDPDCRSRLPEDVSIRALCYGSPPVFRMRDGEQITFPEIVIVNNDKDGIIRFVMMTMILSLITLIIPVRPAKVSLTCSTKQLQLMLQIWIPTSCLI